MENTNYSHQSSGDSSPLSREIEFENPDDPHTSYKVKFMCSYGGKIQPRLHDPSHHLSYLGGDTKILSLDRSSSFSSLLSKLSSISNSPSHFSVKYQLPGEDLDSLISVTNDEDLEHLMAEYDRLSRAYPKPPRLRIFLFPNPNCTSDSVSDVYLFKEMSKPDGAWFVDALNSVQFDHSPPPPTTPGLNPDFLFGFDNDNYSSAPDLNDQVEQQPPPPPIQYYGPMPVPISAGYWTVTADQIQHQQPVYLFQHEKGGHGFYNVPQMPSQPPSLIRQQMSYVDGTVYWPPPGYQVVSAAAGAGAVVDNQALQN